MPKISYKKKRIRLWRKKPHCIECGVLTILPENVVKGKGKRYPDNMATIGHRYSRYDERRKTATPQEKRYRLLCLKCNNAEVVIEEEAMTLKEKQIRSGHSSKNVFLHFIKKFYYKFFRKL